MLFDRVLPLFRTTPTPAANAPANDNEPVPGACDNRGNLWVRTIVQNAAGDPLNPVYIAYADNVAPVAMAETAAFLYGFDGATADRIRSGLNNSDGQAVLATGLLAANSHNLQFNGTTFDRERNNTDITVLASAARVASVNSADIVNYNAKGLHLVIDVTAIAATPSITVTIQGRDALSGQYYTILASAAIVAVGTTVLRVYPALVAAANLIANDILPRTWRVSVTAVDADSITYSVGASLIL